MARGVFSSADYLSIGSAILTAEPITFSAWIYPTVSQGGIRVIMGLFDTADNGCWRINATSGNTIEVLKRNDAGSAASAVTTAIVNLTAWNHVAATFGSDTARAVLLNGGNKVTNSTSIADPTPINTAVGVDLDVLPAAGFAEGYIAEVAIWAAELTDAEIAILAKGTSPLLVRPDALVAYWPIVGRHSPEIDLVGGSHLTVTGTISTQAHVPVRYPPRRKFKFAASQVPVGGAGVTRPWLKNYLLFDDDLAGFYQALTGETISADSLHTISWLQGLALDRPISEEWSSSLETLDHQTPVEILQGITLERSPGMEISSGQSVASILNADWLALISADGSWHVDWLMTASNNFNWPVEILEGVAGTGGSQIEQLQGIATDGVFPVEWQGVIVVTMDGVFPFEFSQAIPSDAGLSSDFSALIAGDLAATAEILQGLQIDAGLSSDFSQDLTLSPALAIEALQGVTLGRSLGEEILLGAASPNIVSPVGILQGIASDRIFPSEWQGAAVITMDGSWPMDWTAVQEPTFLIPVESSQNVESVLLTVEDWLAVAIAGARASVEVLQGLTANISAELASDATSQIDQIVRVDWSQNIGGDQSLNVEGLIGLRSDQSESAEILLGAAGAEALVVDWSGVSSLDAPHLVEWSGTVGSEFSAPVDWSALALQDLTVRVELLESVVVSALTQIEARGFLAGIVETARLLTVPGRRGTIQISRGSRVIIVTTRRTP